MRDMWKVATFAAFIFMVVLGAASAGSNTFQSPGHTTQTAPNISPEYYRNISGNLVHRPLFSAEQPAGATAHCADGAWSFSQHRRGTCNYHGGVARWLN